MKRILTLSILVALIIASCSKKEVITTIEPAPGGVIKQTGIQLTITGVPQSTQPLFAVVTIETNTGEQLLSNRKIPLKFKEGNYVTDSIVANAGEYRLTKLLVTGSSDTALYATPRAQSPRQGEITTPLARPINVKQDEKTNSTYQALQVRNADTPESFGYTGEEMGLVAELKVKLHLSITVGTREYDSLPGTLEVDAIDQNGAQWRKEIELIAGMNTISLPEKYKTFLLTVHKWQTFAEKSLTKQQLTGATIKLTATRAAKKLFEESTFTETGYGLEPDSRVEYTYLANSNLKEVNYFGKLLDKAGLHLTQKHNFIYHDGLLDTISKYSGTQVLESTLAIFYTAGKISNMHSVNGTEQIGAAYEYRQVPGYHEIEADYLFQNGNTMNYRMHVQNGNLMSDRAISSRGGGESGTYQYDHNINPYEQMNYPDIYLSRSSKNNRIGEQKNYAGGFPTVLPYKWEYLYDEDGYPRELWTSYRGYTSGQHLYRIKKVFKYK